MSTTWKNSDGLVVHFGTRATDNDRPVIVAGTGLAKELVVEFTYADLPVGPVDGDSGVIHIPAGGYLKSARIQVDTAFADGTSLTVGTAQQDGTAIDADGIFTAAELATANLTAGAVIEASGGADVGTVIDGTNDAYITVAATGTYTAGTARIVIEYVPKYDA